MLRKLSVLLLIVPLLTGASWQRRAAQSDRMPYLVLIVMDGFRPDYMQLAPMHHLRELMARGHVYSSAWVGQMESETPTGHATIGSGVLPRKHGVVGFGWRNPVTGSFTWMPTDLRQIRAGALTRQIEAGGAPSIADLIHEHNSHDLVASMSGEKYYASAAMGAGADYVLYGHDDHGEHPVAISSNVPPAGSKVMSVHTTDSTAAVQDQFSASLAVQFARSVRPRALLVNLPGTDIAGHLNGAMRDPADMTPVIRGVDNAIGRIMATYRQLGIFNRTLFVVTADHGMAANDHIVPIHTMYGAVSATKDATLDEEFRITLGSIWVRDPQQSATIASAITSKHLAHIEGALYRTSYDTPFTADPWTATHVAPPLLRAYLDLADTEAGPTGPQVILPYAEGTTGLTVKDRKLWGTHGGFSWQVQHIPLIIAGPGVKRGSSRFPAALVDVAPTIERLLGLSVPAGVDGVVLADALQHSTQAENVAERGVSTRRVTDERVIQQHSLQQERDGGRATR